MKLQIWDTAGQERFRWAGEVRWVVVFVEELKLVVVLAGEVRWVVVDVEELKLVVVSAGEVRWVVVVVE